MKITFQRTDLQFDPPLTNDTSNVLNWSLTPSVLTSVKCRMCTIRNNILWVTFYLLYVFCSLFPKTLEKTTWSRYLIWFHFSRFLFFCSLPSYWVFWGLDWLLPLLGQCGYIFSPQLFLGHPWSLFRGLCMVIKGKVQV